MSANSNLRNFHDYKFNARRNANTYNPHLYRQLRRTIGSNIHALRLERGVTLHRLSLLTGISIELLDQFEMGKNEIALRELLKISCVLGVEVGDITN